VDHILNTQTWAEEVFQNCDLGDSRRTQRLIKVAENLANQTGESLSTSCGGDTAALEGAYRFIRNDNILADSIALGGYHYTAEKAAAANTILALEDTTTLSFKHEVSSQLGDLGGAKKSVSRGFYVHSVLLVDAEREHTIGLIDQRRWMRDYKDRGITEQRRKRQYTSKESYKWEEASRRINSRFGELQPRMISVADREADIFNYLHYKVNNNQRFIVRAAYNRRLVEEHQSLFDAIEASPVLGNYKVDIVQKSGRTARTANLELRSCSVNIKLPLHPDTKLSPIRINVVIAEEIEAPAGSEALKWIIFTSELVSTFEEARLVTHYYEMRWRIEEFHKAWKTGAGVERQRMQFADNLERMAIILAFHAVRLLQLKEGFEVESREGTGHSHKDKKQNTACTTLLSAEQWKILWFSIQPKNGKKKRLPKKPPSIGWAYQAIAKLGGWNDSKRTGRASWITVWKGWFRLQERLEGVKLANDYAII